jgi:hypothetical protein
MGIEDAYGCRGACRGLKIPSYDNSRGGNSFAEKFRKRHGQLRDDDFRDTHPLPEILECIAGERYAQKGQCEQGEERAEEEPANQEFSEAVGIKGKAQEECRGWQNVKSCGEPEHEDFVHHVLRCGAVAGGETKRTAR